MLILHKDFSDPKITEAEADEMEVEETAAEMRTHIPRPKNSWILYRQAKSKEIMEQQPGITAAGVCKYIPQTRRRRLIMFSQNCFSNVAGRATGSHTALERYGCRGGPKAQRNVP